MTQLLPDSYRLPTKVLWAQRKKFISVVVESPVAVTPGSAVYLMSDDGCSVALVFRGDPLGDDAPLSSERESGIDEVFATVINFFDAARYGVVEGPAVVDRNRVKLGFVKETFREWPRLTKEVAPEIRHTKMEYDWDLDNSYEEDEESESSGSDSSSDGGRDEGCGVQTCQECGDQYVELGNKKTSIEDIDGEDANGNTRNPSQSPSLPSPSSPASTKGSPSQPAAASVAKASDPSTPLNSWLLYSAVFIGGGVSAVALLMSSFAQ